MIIDITPDKKLFKGYQNVRENKSYILNEDAFDHIESYIEIYESAGDDDQ